MNKLFSRRSAISASFKPPQAPSGNPYFNPNIADGLARLPWTTMFSYTSPGYLDLGVYGNPPAASTPDGRVAVVNDPGGTSEKCIRFEMRNSDPLWSPPLTLMKAEIRTLTSYTMNKATANEGDERWFGCQVYMPYSEGGEQFNWSVSGADTFMTIWDIHDDNPTISVNWYGGSRWASLCVPAGYPTAYPAGWQRTNLWRLLNDDGTRYLPNYNRWITYVLGVRMGVGNGVSTNGWVEAWVDGVNVIPRVNRVTLWVGDTNAYYKHGLYKNQSGVLGGNGTSVLYYRRDKIGMTKGDVS